jgi:hydroxymethylpyrimidine/phosphomethylpyrimidine kinase
MRPDHALSATEAVGQPLPTRGRVLIIAGSDSGGGAGIQADIKTVTAFGGYAATAITALTAQNTLGVQGLLPIAAAFVRQQIDSVMSDLGADAVKAGMLVDAATIATVADGLTHWATDLPFVLDPVMVAKGGAKLLDPRAIVALKRRLLPLATVLTPNVPEAEMLTGLTITDHAAMWRAAEALLTLGLPAVLLKGGHIEGDTVLDLLATEGGVEIFESPRILTRHTHGTGCTLASAIAAGLAQGVALRSAVTRARAYVHAAIVAAPGLGAGQGPLGHARPV